MKKRFLIVMLRATGIVFVPYFIGLMFPKQEHFIVNWFLGAALAFFVFIIFQAIFMIINYIKHG